MAAFKDNQSVMYIIGPADTTMNKVKALMNYSFDICLRYGEVWFSGQMDTCALILYPHRKQFSLLEIWLDIKLIYQAIGFRGISKALNRKKMIKKVLPTVPMFYLWYIGVKPERQNLGKGSQLLNELLELATQKKLPVYLETSTTGNLSWYSKFGFEIYDQLDFGYTLYFLKRIHYEK